ncbi:MAG: phosphoribosyltransferase [Chromatiales bacterium]
MTSTVVHDLPALRDRAPVFRDRAHAGEILASMLEARDNTDAFVLGIPAGGVPVAAEIARRLYLALDVLPVSKLLLPWNTESGFGAVAFDGTEWINEDMARYYRLNKQMVAEASEAARTKVQRRVQRFRGDRPFPALAQRAAIVVDDGVAGGSTLRAAIRALRRLGAGDIMIATPTGHTQAVYAIAHEVSAVYCANLRGGYTFAVASAYENWTDVTEDEVARSLDGFGAIRAR